MKMRIRRPRHGIYPTKVAFDSVEILELTVTSSDLLTIKRDIILSQLVDLDEAELFPL
jgi:hypothetical protein